MGPPAFGAVSFDVTLWWVGLHRHCRTEEARVTAGRRQGGHIRSGCTCSTPAIQSPTTGNMAGGVHAVPAITCTRQQQTSTAPRTRPQQPLQAGTSVTAPRLRCRRQQQQQQQQQSTSVSLSPARPPMAATTVADLLPVVGRL